MTVRTLELVESLAGGATEAMTVEQETAKLRLVVDTAREVWGSA